MMCTRAGVPVFLRRCMPPTILCCLLACSAVSPAWTAPRTFSLSEALELAHRNNLSLQASFSKIDKAHALEDQALAARYPKLVGTAIASPIFKVTGDAANSTNDLHTWGVWLTGSLTVLQPVYSWGKLTSLREAARRNIAVQTADVASDRNQLDYDIKEVYYGSTLTEQLYHFLDDGKNDLADVQKKIDDDQLKKHPKIPRRDMYRFKVFAAEADYRWQEAQKFKNLARHALSLRIGLDPDEESVPQESTLVAIDAAPPTEEQLYEMLKAQRPELSQLSNGIQAKEALLDAERSNKFPIIFVGGMLTMAHSNVRTPQASAFAFDPYNRSSGGVGVGLQWNFDFATTLANEASIRTEITELERRQSYALQGFRLELKKSIEDLKEARAHLVTAKAAFDVGRRWLTSETMNYSLGFTEIRDLIDAYLARAKTAKDLWDAIYKVNMAWAALSKSVGQEVTPGLAEANEAASSQKNN